jgi:hypothetical protein
MDEAEQDVLGPDVVVVQHPGFFLGQDDDTAGAVGEPLEHLRSSCKGWARHVTCGVPVEPCDAT